MAFANRVSGDRNLTLAVIRLVVGANFSFLSFQDGHVVEFESDDWTPNLVDCKRNSRAHFESIVEVTLFVPLSL